MDPRRPFPWSPRVGCLGGHSCGFVALILVLHLEDSESEEPMNYARREFCSDLAPGGVAVQAHPAFDRVCGVRMMMTAGSVS